jgi:hypothetical protein
MYLQIKFSSLSELLTVNWYKDRESVASDSTRTRSDLLKVNLALRQLPKVLFDPPLPLLHLSGDQELSNPFLSLDSLSKIIT